MRPVLPSPTHLSIQQLTTNLLPKLSPWYDWITRLKHVTLSFRALFTLRTTIPPLPLPPLTTKVSLTDNTPFNLHLSLFTITRPKPTAFKGSLSLGHTLSNSRYGA
jgi:hypothetical protein